MLRDTQARTNVIDFLVDSLANCLAIFLQIDCAMTKIRRVEIYFSPKDAERFTGLSRNALIRYVRRGALTQFRTTGGHRRYSLSELKALCEALDRRPAGVIKWKG